MAQLKELFTSYDLRRLESYARQLVDYHVVVDMLPVLAKEYILGGFGDKSAVNLSPAQSAILMSLGLQHKTVSDLERQLSLPSSQVLALFNKVVRKLSTLLRSVEESALVTEIGPEDHVQAAANSLPSEGLEQSLNADLVAAGDDGGRNEAEECDKDDGVFGGKEYEDGENAKKVTGTAKDKSHQCNANGDAAYASASAGGGYEIAGDEGEWDSILARATKEGAPDIVSIKATKRSARVGVDAGESCRKKKVKRVRK
jgi:hypothetical protein